MTKYEGINEQIHNHVFMKQFGNQIANRIAIIIIGILIIGCSNYEESYYSDGQIKYRVRLINGERNGALKKYFKDGSLQFISNWSNGKKTGKSILYYRGGMKKVEENFQLGLLHGQMKEYDSLGSLIGLVNYEFGNKKNEMSYFPNGQLRSKAKTWNDSVLCS